MFNLASFGVLGGKSISNVGKYLVVQQQQCFNVLFIVNPPVGLASTDFS